MKIVNLNEYQEITNALNRYLKGVNGSAEIMKNVFHSNAIVNALPIQKLLDGVSYYKVAQTVMEEQTLKRELSSLDTIKDYNPKYLLTMDYTPITSYNGIKQLNVLEWLTKSDYEGSFHFQNHKNCLPRYLHTCGDSLSADKKIVSIIKWFNDFTKERI